jgi:Tol biopolymer transport system component
MRLSKRFLRSAFIAAAVMLCLAWNAVAAVDPGLEWKTISTAHFDVHFHAGAEWTGAEAARIAEEIYPAITGLYGYEPKRCHIVILDTEDYANGAAFFYDNKLEIWATNLEFHLRGTTPWLRNVITHEFTHIVSIQAAMKMPLRIPSIYFQAVDFESEKRPDVITGYPDLIVSYPIAGTVVPAWWAEGVAQYQAPNKQTDCWDTHRDMILRAAVIEDRMLTYDEMGFLGHRSLGNEQVYDHGYGLVRYIATTHGPESIARTSKHLGDWNRLTIDGALKKATGKSGDELYEAWKVSLRDRYQRMLVDVRANAREGKVLSDQGFMTLDPTFDPDGTRVALLSNEGSDYASTSLYLVDRDGKNFKQVEGGVSSRAVFSPDGTTLVYAKHTRADVYGARLSDLYAYTIATKKEKRLSKKLRASEPQFSPDGRSIVCVLNQDGTHRLAVMNADGSGLREIRSGVGGVQLYAPQYSPDGSRILFGIFESGTREVASIASDGSDFRYEIQSPNDERDARWTPDGSGVVFASDRTGIFNIYGMNTETGEVDQLTNVVGGAFMPDLALDGTLVYSEYTAKGYRAMTMASDAGVVATLTRDAYVARAAGPFEECADLKLAGGAVIMDAIGEDRVEASIEPGVEGTPPTETSTGSVPEGAESLVPLPGGSGETPSEPTGLGVQAPELEPKPYKWDYTGFQFFPRFVLWDGTPRLGIFVASNEILDRQSLFFGGSYGADGEFDLIFDFELRRLFPVIFMEYYKVRQKYEDQFPVVEEDRYYYVDYRYDVWSADLGVRLEFEDPYSLTQRNDVSIWWNHSEYNIFLEPEYAPLSDPTGARTPTQPVGWRYFVGNDAHARWYYKSITRAVDSVVNPRGGREFTIDVMYAMDELFDSGIFEYGVNPLLTDYDFGQYTVDWREYIPLPGWRHTLQVRLMGSVIDKSVDDFFWVYMGGMDRLRGYTYYAIGGRKGALAGATYRFPIWRRINKQASWLTFKDIYGSIFYEAASAWNEGNLPTDDPALERDYYSNVGGELRMNLGSWYMYPTTVSVVGAYALDNATYVNPIFDIPVVEYTPQWTFYLNIGFGF